MRIVYMPAFQLSLLRLSAIVTLGLGLIFLFWGWSDESAAAFRNEIMAGAIVGFGVLILILHFRWSHSLVLSTDKIEICRNLLGLNFRRTIKFSEIASVRYQFVTDKILLQLKDGRQLAIFPGISRKEGELADQVDDPARPTGGLGIEIFNLSCEIRRRASGSKSS